MRQSSIACNTSQLPSDPSFAEFSRSSVKERNDSNFHNCEQMAGSARASRKEKAPCCHRDLHMNSHELGCTDIFCSVELWGPTPCRKEGSREKKGSCARGSHSRNQRLPLRISWQMGGEAYPPKTLMNLCTSILIKQLRKAIIDSNIENSL